MEETETSSQSSSKHHKNNLLTFSNQSALETLENETGIAETVIDGDHDFDEEPAGSGALSFVNRSALDLEHGEATEDELKGGGEEGEGEGLQERNNAITTSFRKITPVGKFNGHDTTELKPSGSPLTRYAPRGSSIAPADVKGEFVHE